MAQATSRSVRLRPREQFWLDHLRTARRQGQTLKAYAQTHELSVSALYTAHSTLKRRGVLGEPAAPAPTLVPVRIPPAGAAFRVHLPNGVVVEVASHVESAACAAVLECASRLP
ncbi:MAG: hypothetical protein F4103_04475 [Boseongicola sp. SB0673_bin_14]|nr:hypothetical protein [Boseongicola sp. SB0673_bin_14]